MEDAAALQQELQNLEERVDKLGREKSYLQLSNHMMSELSRVPGLENTVDKLLETTVYNIGGRNLSIYYQVRGVTFFADISGERRQLEEVQDPLVEKVLSTGEFVDSEETEAGTQLTATLPAEMQKATTLVFPLSVGGVVFGAFKMEGMSIGAREFLSPWLFPFFNYAAMVLKNEIENYTSLRMAYDEVAKARDRLEDKVRERTAELTEVNRRLAEELAERKMIEEQLRHKNRELDNFAYVISHDLKAPLRAITHLSAWIEEDIGAAVSEEVRQNMNLLRGRVLRLENLIDGILEYSRIGRVRETTRQCQVGQLLDDIRDDLALPDGFKLVVGPGMPELVTDCVRLQQVFANLIDNAFKHHHRQEGEIRVSVDEQEEWYEFTVSDDGPGISPEFHEKVFALFQVLAPRDKKENTGVGLALVKKIVESQNGTVRLESEAGQGSTFRFTWMKRME
ncbi:MAG TPA: ATP-binding protein [Patescibacteria group bacterium]|nr:ATP-binding protein [Patescibacteria group bacterium]